MDDPEGADDLADIDDSALEDAEKADAEDKSNEESQEGQDSKANNELEQALQDTLGANFDLNSMNIEDMMKGMMGGNEEEVKQEATSGQEGTTSVSDGQAEIKTETGNEPPKIEPQVNQSFILFQQDLFSNSNMKNDGKS